VTPIAEAIARASATARDKLATVEREAIAMLGKPLMGNRYVI